MDAEKREVVLTGGCQCGAVRYALFAQPDPSICHCRMCQKAVGGPFAALAAVNVGDLAWTRGAATRFDSSSAASRGFCSKCGTPLTYQGRTLDSDRIEITIGSLDMPHAAPPRQQFGTEGRLSWFETLHNLPASVTDAKFDGLTSHQHPDHDT